MIKVMTLLLWRGVGREESSGRVCHVFRRVGTGLDMLQAGLGGMSDRGWVERL